MSCHVGTQISNDENALKNSKDPKMKRKKQVARYYWNKLDMFSFHVSSNGKSLTKTSLDHRIHQNLYLLWATQIPTSPQNKKWSGVSVGKFFRVEFGVSP